MLYFVKLPKGFNQYNFENLDMNRKVTSCGSNTYISSSVTENSHIEVYGCSDSSIAKGFIQIIMNVFNKFLILELEDIFNLFKNFLSNINIDFKTESRRNYFKTIYTISLKNLARTK